jgi:hypothetical protein
MVGLRSFLIRHLLHRKWGREMTSSASRVPYHVGYAFRMTCAVSHAGTKLVVIQRNRPFILRFWGIPVQSNPEGLSLDSIAISESSLPYCIVY